VSVAIVGSLRRVSEPEPMDTDKVLEHLMEHIMRKQNQIDWLRRARRQP
jgi:uncharacterized protein (DUF2461 family)